MKLKFAHSTPLEMCFCIKLNFTAPGHNASGRTAESHLALREHQEGAGLDQERRYLDSGDRPFHQPH